MNIFFDTMIFLHYKSFDQLDFDSILGKEAHVVQVPMVTIRELDKHKNTHSLNRIKERARKVLKKFEGLRNGGILRPGVDIEFIDTMPSVDFNHHGLDPNLNDDKLAAAALQFKVDNVNKKVVLVTQDTALKWTAERLGISVIVLSDEYKLTVEPDPLEAENRELKKSIQKLSSALPKLSVYLDGPNTSAKFILIQSKPLSEQDIKERIEELKIAYPKQKAPPKQPRRKEPSKFGIFDIDVSGLVGIRPEEYERYNREVDKYLEESEEYMRGTSEWESLRARTIWFDISLANLGTAPADDVDVHLHFPDGFKMMESSDFPNAPSKPMKPKEPRTSAELVAQFSQMNISDQLLDLPLNYSHRISGPSEPRSFNIEKSNSYDIRDYFPRVKHGFVNSLPEMALIFDSFESACSFHCTFSVCPGNLPEPVTGKLHFVIKKTDEG